jgi:hypothetical protein
VFPKLVLNGFTLTDHALAFETLHIRTPACHPGRSHAHVRLCMQAVSPNVRRFRFALPEADMLLGLPIGSHISIAAKDAAGKPVMRPYTPVSDDNLKGFVEFVIKVGVHLKSAAQFSYVPFPHLKSAAQCSSVPFPDVPARHCLSHASAA